MIHNSSLLKSVAIILVVIYLAPPLQWPSHYILHSIAHLTKVPEQIIAHSKPGMNHPVPIYQHHDHHTADADHFHEIIEVFKSVFNSESQKKHQSVLELIDVDKHFLYKTHFISDFMVCLGADPDPFLKLTTRNGFLPSTWKPPLL